MTDINPEAVLASDVRSEATLAQDLKQLAGEARSLAQAELAFQKSRAFYVASEARGIVVVAASALVVLFFAVMAFVVGLVLALGPILGRWGAMLAVTIGLLLVVIILAVNVRSRIRRLLSVSGASKHDGRPV